MIVAGNKWKTSRIDGKRSSITLRTASAPEAVAGHARARFERRWYDVQDAMKQAGAAGVRFGRNAIVTRRTKRTGKLEAEFRYKFRKLKGGKAELEVGWLGWSGKPYHVWQEHGTLDKRVRGVGGKRYDRPIRGWQYRGSKTGRGIDPMLVLPDARRVVNETFRSELRL